MRSFVRRAIVLVTCAGAGVFSGCEAKQATEYVAGVSTQVKVPRDLKAIRIEVSVGGAPINCQGYRVYDNHTVQLPRSLGAFAATAAAASNQSGPITYTIAGVTSNDIDSEFFSLCSAAKVGDSQVRVLRRSRQPYIADEIRFIPMPLKYSCFDKQCGLEETCKGGKCVSADVSLDYAKANFPEYTPGLIDGSGGGCFDSKICMGARAPALAVDPDNCIYAVANGKSAPPPADPLVDPFRGVCATAAECPSQTCTNGRCEALKPGTPWDGTNVEVIYDGGLGREILDLDADEGFTFADPAKPQLFKLAPGLCEMVKGLDVNPAGADVGAACKEPKDCKSDICKQLDPSKPEDRRCASRPRITGVVASGTCQPKRITEPFCPEDQLQQMGLNPDGTSPNEATEKCDTIELKPPRSALMLVVDKTVGHSAFFNTEQIKPVELPLQDPAFERTDIGLMYAPVGDGGCAASEAPRILLQPALTARKKVVNDFLDLAANPSGLAAGAPSYEGALASSYKALKALPATTYFKRAVLVVGNRDFNVESCGGITGTPAAQALAERTAPSDPLMPINTYVIQLAKTDPNKPLETDILDPGLGPLASSGSGDPLKYSPDARGTKKNAKDSFQQVINSLATCTYDVPVSTAPAADDLVSFNDPIYGVTTRIDPNAGCNAEGVPGAGWGYGTAPESSKKRIFLCQDSCTTYQKVLAQASDFALIYGKPPIPVPIFSHKKVCDVK